MLLNEDEIVYVNCIFEEYNFSSKLRFKFRRYLNSLNLNCFRNRYMVLSSLLFLLIRKRRDPLSPTVFKNFCIGIHSKRYFFEIQTFNKYFKRLKTILKIKIKNVTDLEYSNNAIKILNLNKKIKTATFKILKIMNKDIIIAARSPITKSSIALNLAGQVCKKEVLLTDIQLMLGIIPSTTKKSTATVLERLFDNDIKNLEKMMKK